jgi:hypothetical protein
MMDMLQFFGETGNKTDVTCSIFWEDSVTLYENWNWNSTPGAANSGKSADLILHRESPLFKNRSDATADFKNQKSVGVP